MKRIMILSCLFGLLMASFAQAEVKVSVTAGDAGTTASIEIEPLDIEIGGPPKNVIAPAPEDKPAEVPSVVMVPGMGVYMHKGLYFYHFGDMWYYGKAEKGPWHKLPKEYWPKKIRKAAKKALKEQRLERREERRERMEERRDRRHGR